MTDQLSFAAKESRKKLNLIRIRQQTALIVQRNIDKDLKELEDNCPHENEYEIPYHYYDDQLKTACPDCGMNE